MAKSIWSSIADNMSSGGATSFGKFLNGLGASIFRYIGSYLGESMSNREKERLDYEDEINDENAEVSWQHQKEFQENYLSPHAQMMSQAQAYQELGINKMAFAGQSAPGASSASAPQASAPSGGGDFNPAELLSTILNFKLGQRRLDIEEELLPYKQDELWTRSGLNVSRAYEIETLLPSKVENLDASTDLMREQINTQETIQELNRVGVTRAQADALVSLRQAAILAIEGENKQRYLDSEIALNEANQQLAFAAASQNYARVKEITQNIENLKVEHDNLLKDGIYKTIENGQMAHQLTIVAAEAGNIGTKIKQENAGRVVDMVCDGINTVTGVVSTAITGVNASATVRTSRASKSRAQSYRMDVQHRISRPSRRR